VRSFLALLAAVNPMAVAVALWPRERGMRMALAAAIGVAVAVVAAAASEPALDALDVTPGTFRVATAVVLGITGARWLIFSTPSTAADGPASGWARVAVPLLVPVIITPQLVMVSLSVGVDDGVVVVAIAAAAGLVLAWFATLATKRHQVAWNAGVRFVGALAVTVALALAVDGVKTI